jgi:hypothetical protein
MEKKLQSIKVNIKDRECRVAQGAAWRLCDRDSNKVGGAVCLHGGTPYLRSNNSAYLMQFIGVKMPKQL